MNKYWKQWDMVRHIMYTTASTVPSKKKLPKISKWFPLPIDVNTVISSERANEMFKILKEKMNGNKRATSENNG